MVHGRGRCGASRQNPIRLRFRRHPLPPVYQRPPSETNLRRARERLGVIKRQIQLGVFSFAEEFPDYRYPERLTGISGFQLCGEVFDEYLAENPARHLRCIRLGKSDRPKIDPFSMHNAEALIAAIHRDWGEAQGNYDKFRFFTGLRPSEEIALVLSDVDLVHGVVSVNKARVHGIDRCKTKTGEDRRVELERG